MTNIMPSVTISELMPAWAVSQPLTTPIASPNIKAAETPRASDCVSFMTTISGSAMVASSAPIEISTSPEMKTMAQPVPAISGSDAWPSTLLILRTEKKFSAAAEKKAMTMIYIHFAGNEDDGAARAGNQRQRRLAKHVADIAHGKEVLCRRGKKGDDQDLYPLRRK